MPVRADWPNARVEGDNVVAPLVGGEISTVFLEWLVNHAPEEEQRIDINDYELVIYDPADGLTDDLRNVIDQLINHANEAAERAERGHAS